ncbi:MAG: hypothetical protein ACRCYY_07985 [Trueperaceae bacterium]
MMWLQPRPAFSQRLRFSQQSFAWLLSVALGLAIFISPYQLHHSSASVFFVNQGSNQSAQHDAHSHHGHTDEEQSPGISCLRCILQGFELPETALPLITFLVVLSFLKLLEPIQPFSFIPLSKSARAPPL